RSFWPRFFPIMWSLWERKKRGWEHVKCQPRPPLAGLHQNREITGKALALSPFLVPAEQGASQHPAVVAAATQPTPSFQE
uniref:Uncharacterized protein n=1 Tax=Bubo bubo TaxID=30461 RepID=A0A8C0ICQ6_BUBBB